MNSGMDAVLQKEWYAAADLALGNVTNWFAYCVCVVVQIATWVPPRMQHPKHKLERWWFIRRHGNAGMGGGHEC